MEVQELKKLIKENSIPNFLIFAGEEWMIQKLYIEQIAKVKNLQIKYADSISDIWTSLTSSSLFDTPTLYVLQDDKEVLTNEKIYTQLDSIKNMLILTLTSVDKRLKMLKLYKSSIVEFNALNEAVLKRYIQKEIDLNDRNCNILMEICDYNYGHCLLEIDKIKQFMRARGTDDIYDHNFTNSEFEKLLEDGVFYIPPRDTIWDFIKAVLQDKINKAYELYQDLKELQSPTLAILTNLYNNTRAVYQVQTCHSKDIAKSTGLTSWQIRNAKECVGKNSDEDLEYLLRLIQKVESGIKKGTIEESIAVDYILVNWG